MFYGNIYLTGKYGINTEKFELHPTGIGLLESKLWKVVWAISNKSGCVIKGAFFIWIAFGSNTWYSYLSKPFWKSLTYTCISDILTLYTELNSNSNGLSCRIFFNFWSKTFFYCFRVHCFLMQLKSLGFTPFSKSIDIVLICLI